MQDALRNPTLRRILATSATGNLADGMFLLALPLVAALAGASPFWIGALSAAQTVWWLLSVPLSTLVDRLGPGPLLWYVRPLRIVVAAGAAASLAVPGQAQLVVLLIISAAWGFLEVLSDSAVATLPALLLGDTVYDESYALLYSVQRVTNLVLGPALGGVLIATGSWVPFVGAAVLLVVAFIIQQPLLGRAEAQATRKPDHVDIKSFGADLIGGWKHIKHDRFLRAIMITLAGIVVAEGVVATVAAPYARDGRLIANWESVLGFLRSSAGLTSIGAALTTAALARSIGRLRVMSFAAAGGVAAPLLLAVQPSVSFILAAMLVSAVSEALWVPLAQTEIVRRTPKALLARTRATLMFVTWGSLPITSLVGGIVATLFGVRIALWIAAGIACAAALWGIWPLAIQSSAPISEVRE
jgi:MFS family permease